MSSYSKSFSCSCTCITYLVFKELQRQFPKLLKIVSNLHIRRSKYPRQNFEGIQCRSLLKKMGSLNIPESFKELKDVFLTIRELHHKVINNFRSTWDKLTK
jgi:hypothetical protein